MENRNNNEIDIKLATPFIKLQQLLKLSNAVTQGGEAKHLITEGFVLVDGVIVTERGKKIYPGAAVTLQYGSEAFQINVS